LPGRRPRCRRSTSPCRCPCAARPRPHGDRRPAGIGHGQPARQGVRGLGRAQRLIAPDGVEQSGYAVERGRLAHFDSLDHGQRALNRIAAQDRSVRTSTARWAGCGAVSAATSDGSRRQVEPRHPGFGQRPRTSPGAAGPGRRAVHETLRSLEIVGKAHDRGSDPLCIYALGQPSRTLLTRASAAVPQPPLNRYTSVARPAPAPTAHLRADWQAPDAARAVPDSISSKTIMRKHRMLPTQNTSSLPVGCTPASE